MLVSHWPQNFLQIYTSKINPPGSEKLFTFSKADAKMCGGPYKKFKK